ncbi:site-specific integrase [Streptomyces sp. NPDC091371]|uniref:tyrosine-type recombinase/integrase n=1 Tax=Streptomyces sp. NPDC091371 TaxID=3155303 RepID=UPI003411FFDD
MTTLPLLSAARTATTRTGSDRLEMLHALIAAPTFDPLFRPDSITIPGDNDVYGWNCRVSACERSQTPTKTFCATHADEWYAWRDEGGNIAEFLRQAEPLASRSQRTFRPCLLCPQTPARSREGLCFLHSRRFVSYNKLRRQSGRAVDLAAWLATQQELPGFGKCQVISCADTADHPLRLCGRHRYRYQQQGSPGGARLPAGWTPRILEQGGTIPVTYQDEATFRQWCTNSSPVTRMNGRLTLLGLRPLVKAEIKWALFHHTQQQFEGGRWPLPWIQYLINACRDQAVDSLIDFDHQAAAQHPGQVARVMLDYLRQIYFTRADTKDAGFIETEHYGVHFNHRSTVVDLSAVSQRWLRDLLWDFMDSRLTVDPPRGFSTVSAPRRGCVELSAFLEAHAPGGGHDPALLTEAHAVDFVADQRHRAKHGLRSLGLYTVGNKAEQTVVTNGTMATTFSNVRRVLRAALDLGEAERIGLGRAFIVTFPIYTVKAGRRRPFPDDVARALANEANLARLETFDIDDRGLRDIWEALVLTGRRGTEVSKVRLDCIGRLNRIPMFWHDQTKVGNYDQAIRIPERLYERIEKRQAKTVARFVQNHGRPPTSEERPRLALFPRRSTNRDGTHSVSHNWFNSAFRSWVDTLDIAHCVPHQARHTLATNLLRNGANLSHVKRYLGQVSERMAEHYTHLANTDPRLNDALNAVWVSGPGSAEPGVLLSSGEPMSREEAEALAIDLTRRSTPAEGGFCTFQPVVNGDTCPWNMDCHNCDKFVMSGADLVYWHRKREQWRTLAERAPDSATADFLHEVFEPTARAIVGLEKALDAIGLLDEALTLDLRRPQDYFGRVWSTAFRAQTLARHEAEDEAA